MQQLYDPYDKQPDPNEQFDDPEFDSTTYWEDLERFEHTEDPNLL